MESTFNNADLDMRIASGLTVQYVPMLAAVKLPVFLHSSLSRKC